MKTSIVTSACPYCVEGWLTDPATGGHVRWTWVGEPPKRDDPRGRTVWPWKYKDLAPCSAAANGRRAGA